MSDQLSDQEKAIIFATCGELEGILAGISEKHELKVIPAFLFYELLSTLKALKERNRELEEMIETQTNNLSVYERVLGETKEAFSNVNPGQLVIGEKEIVIPGVNGPRPEHAHLDMDSAAGMARNLTRARESKQHKDRAIMDKFASKFNPKKRR